MTESRSVLMWSGERKKGQTANRKKEHFGRWKYSEYYYAVASQIYVFSSVFVYIIYIIYTVHVFIFYYICNKYIN